MLNYNGFRETLITQIKDYLPIKYKDFNVELYTVEKINQSREGMCLVDKSKSVSASPVIYVDTLYAHYVRYENLAKTMRMAAEMITEAFAYTPNNYNIELSEDNIVLVLINYEKNKKLLEKLPHVKYLDMAFVFRWLISADDNGTAGGLITNEMADKFGFNTDKLFELAKKNTRRILPPKIESLADMIKRLCREECFCEYESFPLPVYVLSNERAFEGAAYIVYTDILDQLKTRLNDDLYIIPSSINELLIVPKSFAEPEVVRNMVKEVNVMAVSEEEQLSNNVYLYDCEVRMV